MTPERWTRVEELFESALEREPAARPAFLAAACADDPPLLWEVEGLLQSHEEAGAFELPRGVRALPQGPRRIAQPPPG